MIYSNSDFCGKYILKEVNRLFFQSPWGEDNAEEFKNTLVYKLYRYIPESFESRIHFYNWVRLYSKRFSFNVVRDKISQIRRQPKIQEGYEELFEKVDSHNYIIKNNRDNKLAQVLESLNQLEAKPRDKKIFYEICTRGKNARGHYPISEIAAECNLTRRQVYNIKRVIKKKIEKHALIY